MKTLTLVLGLALSISLTAARAVAENSQQSKMKACNTQAGVLKGADRQSFMKDCLSGKTEEAAPEAESKIAAPPKKLTPQEKMKQCNKDATAKSLKGTERKAFMKECLSNKPAK